MPQRRSFLVGCAGAVAMPVLALADLPVATGEMSRSLVPDAAAQLAMTSATPPADLVMRIAGWELPATTGSTADVEAWIHINSSWRANWR
jgi:hypothetical protein